MSLLCPADLEGLLWPVGRGVTSKAGVMGGTMQVSTPSELGQCYEGGGSGMGHLCSTAGPAWWLWLGLGRARVGGSPISTTVTAFPPLWLAR